MVCAQTIRCTSVVAAVAVVAVVACKPSQSMGGFQVSKVNTVTVYSPSYYNLTALNCASSPVLYIIITALASCIVVTRSIGEYKERAGELYIILRN